MKNVNCFIFRTGDDEFVGDELLEGRLRQGWGAQHGSLLDANGDRRTKQVWSQDYCRDWDEEPSLLRHAILSRMLDIKKGDLVLCPKLPNEYFTIARVRKAYQFEMNGNDDFGHMLKVGKWKSVTKWHNKDTQYLSDLFKLTCFRSAVAQVPDNKKKKVICAAKRLLNSDEDTTSALSPDQIRIQRFDESRRDAANSFIHDVSENWTPEQFEAAVGEAFRRKGYERLRGNISTGGGDADHVFSLPIPGFENVSPRSRSKTPLLIVQVKHKQGVDDNDIDGVKQLLDWPPQEDEYIVHSVLFSSADDFTPECRHFAHRAQVILMCGADAGLFML